MASNVSTLLQAYKLISAQKTFIFTLV